jgi:CRISPR-associated endonuclease Csn1
MRIFGLDMGIASVGSAVVDLDEASAQGQIVFAGARVFPAAEDAKTGDSLALPRRMARGMRRRIDRRRFRLDCLWETLANAGLKEAQGGPLTFQSLLQDKRDALCAKDMAASDAALRTDPYLLRVAGLDRKLEPWEWVRVLMHIAARRGFRSNSKAAENDAKSDTGKMNTAIRETEKLFATFESRTVGEYVVKSAQFAEHKRNKAGSYALTLKRDWLQDELNKLFEAQRGFGNPVADETLQRAFVHRFYEQKHYDQGNIDEMIGECQFEPPQQRAAKATWTFQHAMALQKINHLRWARPGEALVPLDSAQRTKVLEMAIKQPHVKYKQIRELIDMPDDARFNGISYRVKKGKDGTVKEADPVKASEDTTFLELKAFHALRKRVIDICGLISWESLRAHPLKLDAIGSALSKFKADGPRAAYMQAAKVEDAVIQASLALTFDGFGFLSAQALQKLIPHLEAGKRYDEAATEVYGDHRGVSIATKTKLLPRIPTEEVRNPVVLRALTQTRKVLNALIREYGTPNRIHIELGREVGKSRDERNEIKDGQDAFKDEKDKAAKHFRDTFPEYGDPKADDLLKFRLWREQDKRCIYSGDYINPENLLAQRHVEIDHILPLSRSQDDGLHNKVICLTRENQHKRNQTPYEWLDGAGDSEKWRAFTMRVSSLLNIRKPKRDRLLRVDFTDATADGFKERNLVDTRYITKYFKTFVETHLHIDVIEGDRQPYVQTGSGKLTSFLRAQWGLIKVRDKSDRHHALDAIVIACATKAMEHRLTRYHQAMEIYTNDPREAAELLDVDTGEITSSHYRDMRKKFPTPWDGFRNDAIAALEAVFVSRPPRRKWSGPLHKETIYGIGKEAGTITQRVRIESVTLSALDKAVDQERNHALYDAVRKRLALHKNDPKKAWATPLEHDNGGGKRLVRAITIADKMGDGVFVRGGIAANGEIVRVDVYKDAKGKNYLVPIYISDFGKTTPQRAIVAYEDEENWLLMDQAFSFAFSLYKDDLIFVSDKKLDGHCKFNSVVPDTRHHFVYFEGVDRATGSISYDTASVRLLSDKVDKKTGKFKPADLRTGVQSLKGFDKYAVDVLGRISRVKKERHLALAKRTDQSTNQASD